MQKLTIRNCWISKLTFSEGSSMYEPVKMKEIINTLDGWIQDDMQENNIGYDCAEQRLLAVIKDRLEGLDTY